MLRSTRSDEARGGRIPRRSLRAACYVLSVWALGFGPAAPAQTLTREGPEWVELDTGFLAGSGFTRLRIEARGNVIVRGGGGNQLAWRTRRRVRASNEAEARAALGGRAARIRMQGDGILFEAVGPLPSAPAAEVEVFAPASLRRAEILSAQGDLLIRDLPADASAMTGGGRIDADGVGGRLEIRSGGGGIQVGHVGGDLRAVTGGGSIQVRQADAGLWAETAGGEIFIGRAGGEVHASAAAGNIQVLHAAGAVEARTGGGAIRVAGAEGPVRADSGGGVIQVSSPGGVRCDSMGGPIRLNGVAGPLFAATLRGGIFADLIAGRELANSILSADSGDITVMIPSNLAVTVEAVSESGPRGRIVTEFAGIRIISGEAGGRTVASGMLNGGGPLLKVAAARGAIYLKRK